MSLKMYVILFIIHIYSLPRQWSARFKQIRTYSTKRYKYSEKKSVISLELEVTTEIK